MHNLTKVNLFISQIYLTDKFAILFPLDYIDLKQYFDWLIGFSLRLTITITEILSTSLQLKALLLIL